ncbi:galactolipase DONGLE, chloroplastic-like [Solanum dulcamara]|uniref:galactolipase DONGLE, chloroplastic-like n=1 Tax=Solanum dulcamara TaxID=45834 RepID=UPI002485B38F|nr:galactolipase DONGLE, chloroplastic-like [Solanum dulcamara]
MLGLPNIPNLNFPTFSEEFLPKPCMVRPNEGISVAPAPPLTLQQLRLSHKLSPMISTKEISKNNAHSVTTSTGVAMDRRCSNSSSNIERLASKWREVQGSKNWENLVDPLDSLLRLEIIRYGEFVAACYDAFNLDPNSKRYLNCKYGKRRMLSEVGLGESGYQVTKYIYATPDINVFPIGSNITIGSSCGKWIGYIAVSNHEETKRLGRRDVLVTFRGTVTSPEWIANLMSSLTPARLDPHNPRPQVKVEAGFLSLYTSNEDKKFGLGSCREQLLSEVGRILNKYKGEDMSITLAGHSMGSALALLLAYDIAELGLNRDKLLNTDHTIPLTVFSFGGPRVGNSGFKERCEELGVKVLRITNVNDPITKLPGVFLNENFRVLCGKYEAPWSCSCYAHVGVEILLDFFKMHNPSCVHDLKTYLSLLKCPKRLQVQREEGIDFFNKAKEFVIYGAQNKLKFNAALQWKNAAMNMVNMVQSQRT